MGKRNDETYEIVIGREGFSDVVNTMSALIDRNIESGMHPYRLSSMEMHREEIMENSFRGQWDDLVHIYLRTAGAAEDFFMMQGYLAALKTEAPEKAEIIERMGNITGALEREGGHMPERRT